MSSQGITFKTCDKKAEIVEPRYIKVVTTPEDLLKETWAPSTKERDWKKGAIRYSRCKTLLQSSFPKDSETKDYYLPRENGFVDTVLMAYSAHHNLVIRPDDIWIAILSQLNKYINAHAEELRHFFVAHEGRRDLKITVLSLEDVDYRIMVEGFAKLLQHNINDPTLYELILPDFSTTTSHDRAICSITMMSFLKRYFKYEMRLGCGIPEVTLLGTKQDYENILGRVQRLASLNMGAEPRVFAALLQPIIRRFIATFDAVAANPENPQIDTDFWGRICHERNLGSGNSSLSGWITAFCVWQTREGRWQGPNIYDSGHNPPDRVKANTSSEEQKLILDGIEYPIIHTGCVPDGMLEAPVTLVNEEGQERDCMVVAGHFATRAVADGGVDEIKTVAPAPFWFMFEKEDIEQKINRAHLLFH